MKPTVPKAIVRGNTDPGPLRPHRRTRATVGPVNPSTPPPSGFSHARGLFHRTGPSHPIARDRRLPTLPPAPSSPCTTIFKGRRPHYGPSTVNCRPADTLRPSTASLRTLLTKFGPLTGDHQ